MQVSAIYLVNTIPILMTVQVKTVLGPIDAEKLGVTMIHLTASLKRVTLIPDDIENDISHHLAVVRRGAFVELDQLNRRHHCDTRRAINWIKELIKQGNLLQILISQGICARSALPAYGGNGYDYVLNGIVPQLEAAGLNRAVLDIHLVKNPCPALT